MISEPAVKSERYPNSENNLYLKLLAKVTQDHDLKVVRMGENLNKLRIIKKVPSVCKGQ